MLLTDAYDECLREKLQQWKHLVHICHSVSIEQAIRGSQMQRHISLMNDVTMTKVSCLRGMSVTDSSRVWEGDAECSLLLPLLIFSWTPEYLICTFNLYTLGFWFKYTKFNKTYLQLIFAPESVIFFSNSKHLHGLRSLTYLPCCCLWCIIL